MNSQGEEKSVQEYMYIFKINATMPFRDNDENKLIFLDAHASPYLLVPARLSQLAFSKDNINAHPLRPMSYWFMYQQYAS